MTKNQKIRIYWMDAVFYYKPYKANKLSPQITIGTLIRENKDFIILKNTKTRGEQRKGLRRIINYIFFENHARFTFIPRGMITEIIPK